MSVNLGVLGVGKKKVTHFVENNKCLKTISVWNKCLKINNSDKIEKLKILGKIWVQFQPINQLINRKYVQTTSWLAYEPGI